MQGWRIIIYNIIFFCIYVYFMYFVNFRQFKRSSSPSVMNNMSWNVTSDECAAVKCLTSHKTWQSMSVLILCNKDKLQKSNSETSRSTDHNGSTQSFKMQGGPYILSFIGPSMNHMVTVTAAMFTYDGQISGQAAVGPQRRRSIRFLSKA